MSEVEQRLRQLVEEACRHPLGSVNSPPTSFGEKTPHTTQMRSSRLPSPVRHLSGFNSAPVAPRNKLESVVCRVWAVDFHIEQFLSAAMSAPLA